MKRTLSTLLTMLMSFWIKASADHSDQDWYLSDYRHMAEQLLSPIDGQIDTHHAPNDFYRKHFKLILDDPLQTKEHHYLAASAYSTIIDYEGSSPEVYAVCQQYPPRQDDFLYRLACTSAGSEGAKIKAKSIQNIAEQAHQKFPDKILSYLAYTRAGDLLYLEGRLHDSIRMYEKAFEVIPANSATEIQSAKINLAIAYASPLLSEQIQRQSLKYYDEVRSWYDRQNKNDESRRASKWLSYNKGIAHLFLFHEYKNAIADFNRVQGYASFEVDAKVFTAYAYAQMGEKAKVHEILSQVDLSAKQDPKRRDFLNCYMELSFRLLGDKRPVTSCLNLNDPQADVLLDLTRTLRTLNLDAEQENMMWHKFYNYFVQHMQPDIQDALTSASAEIELAKARAESRFAELKLKNLALYRSLTFTLIAIVLALVLAVILSIRLWRSSRNHAMEMEKGRARAQHILNSIEEAIIKIRPNLLLEPEDSPHLLDILGRKIFQNSSLNELLALMELPQDCKSLTRECLQACLEEDSLSWEMNRLNLPVETVIQGREIALYWQPILEKGVLKSVLLVMRDVSTIRKLEKHSLEARANADRMIRYAQEILSTHPKAASQFLSGLLLTIESLEHLILVVQDNPAAMHVTHTMKGTARTLGLKELQEQAHDLEEKLKERNLELLTKALSELRGTAQSYMDALQHVVGGIDESRVPSLLEIVASLKPGLQHQLKMIGVPLTKLSVVESVELSPKELHSAREILLHGLTNAADHGFVLADRKDRPLQAAEFEISLGWEPQGKVLTIRDNGAGINYEAIQTLARRRGWQPTEGQRWTDFLFLDGVTTTEEVSASSGRGVGMAAIRDAAARLDGEVSLLDNDNGSGTLLKVVWPGATDEALLNLVG